MASIMEMLFGGEMPNQTPVDYNQAQGILGSSYGPPKSAMMPPQEAPAAPQQKPGILSAPQGGGILDNLGGFTNRLGNALIAGGSRDPGNTLLNLQKADAEAAAAGKPKVQPLADGAFSLISFPDGTTKIVKNEDVAKFLEEQQGLKFNQALEKVKLQGQVNTQTGNDKVNYKADLELAGGPGAPTTYREAVTTQIGNIDKLITALPEIDKVKTSLGGLESPVAANIVDQTWGRIVGSDDYKARRDLESIVNEDVLKLSEKMKGALSDNDIMFLKSIQPKPDDPTDRKITYLQELKKRLDAGEKRRMEAAARISGSGGTQAPTAGAPKTSGGVVQVTNEQEWQNLPAGTVYKDPNGVIRTKK